MKSKLSLMYFMCQTTFFFCLFYKTFCFPNPPCDTPTNAEKRAILVAELQSFEQPLTDAVNQDNQELIQYLLNRIKNVWPKIVEISSAISENLASELDPDTEVKYQQELRKLAARLLFVAKSRHCEYPDETFYKPRNECLPLETSDETKKPCPSDMYLSDGPDNEGFCDCLHQKIFSSLTGSCYSENTQGPCRNGEWFVFKDNTAECEPVPENCPADGEHVYWSPDAVVAKKCWRKGTQGPCPPDQFVMSNTDMGVFCDVGEFTPQFVFAIAPIRLKPCPKGSYRDQFFKCQFSFV